MLTLQIGALRLPYPVLLAPLANITDRPFRLVCRRNGAALVFTEMISAAGIVRQAAKTWALARFGADERPIGIQLFGNDPAILAQAAARLEKLNPDAIDLNFGCPVRKVVKIGAGAAFMEDPRRVAEAVRQVVAATHHPVTVKFRSGPTADHLTVVEAARAAEDAGAAAITVHARTTDQAFRGKANWEVIAQVKQAVQIPVIGNGDVFTPADLQRMLEQTGCDGVMIGRGALGNPWIFARCVAQLEGRPDEPLTPERLWEDIEYHYREALACHDRRGMFEMRKHLGWYSKGLPGAAQYRQRVFHLEDTEEVLRVTHEFFQSNSFLQLHG